MTGTDELPWFHAAVELLEIRRRDRVLALGCSPRQLRGIANLVGDQGTVTVVEPDRGLAEAIAALPVTGMAVLAVSPTAERYGAFDALLCAPSLLPAWPLDQLPGLVRHNLRPGGRFAVDLPAPEVLPVVTAAWARIGGDPGRLAPLHGVADDVLATNLRAAGLRRVETVLGTHLWTIDSPFTLVDLLAPALRLDDRTAAELGRALAAELGATGSSEVLVHRTRVHGLR